MSCQKKAPSSSKTVPEISGQTEGFEREEAYAFTDSLTALSVKKMASWRAYFRLSAFADEHFRSVSPRQALDHAQEFLDLVQELRTSLELPALRTQPVRARLNTLHSEVLRLKDMAEITAIKPEAVQRQIQKMVAVFNALNSKINAVYARQKLDENLSFDESIFKKDLSKNTSSSLLKTKK